MHCSQGIKQFLRHFVSLLYYMLLNFFFKFGFTFINYGGEKTKRWISKIEYYEKVAGFASKNVTICSVGIIK